MSKVFLAGILLLAVLGLRETAPAAKQGKPVGFVSRIQGDGYLGGEKGRRLLTGMDLVVPNDRIVLAGGAFLVLNLSPGSGFEVKGPASFAVTGSGPRFSSGRASRAFRLDKKKFQAFFESLAENGSENYRLTVKNGKLDPARCAKFSAHASRRRTLGKEPLALVNDEVLAPRPFLCWNRHGDAVRYRITVMRSGARLLRAVTKYNHADHSVLTCVLEPETRCAVLVEALGQSGEALAAKEDSFLVRGEEEAKAFAAGEKRYRAGREGHLGPEYWILEGLLCEKYDLILDAVECYRKAAELDVKNTGIRQRIDFLLGLVM